MKEYSLNEYKNKVDDLYEAYPILLEIDGDNHGVISRNSMFKTLHSDEFLSAYGDNCPGFLFVIKGNIKIQKLSEGGEETNLYNIGRGGLCHEALKCMLKRQSLNILGRAIQDSNICIVPMDIVKKYLINNSKFLQVLYEDLYSKFTTIVENKAERVHESLDTRLIKLLISKNSNIIYSTHSELAFELDSAREVISRQLKKLEKQGCINLSRGKIQILTDLNKIVR